MTVIRPRILLTGATGFVGSVILRELIKQQFPVMILVRDASRLKNISSTITIVQCSLENISPDAALAIADFKPDSVIHSAWIGTENTDRNNITFVYANMQASLKLLEITAASGCRQWIGFGSQAEYSPNLKDAINETAPTYPDSAYGIAKLATCHMLQSICNANAIHFIWLRIFASYGPNYKSSYVMPYLEQCFKKQEMPVLKTPNAIWDYIHVNDVAGATLAALNNSNAQGIFNLGTGIGTSVGQIAMMMAEMYEFRDMNVLSHSIDSISGEPTKRVAAIDKIENTLAWKPKIPLKDGLLCS